MNYIYLILILVVIGLAWVVWKCYQKSEADRKEILALEKEKNEYEDLGKGLAEYNQKLQEKKEQVKAKILKLFGTKTRINNHDIAKALDIPSVSIRRYLDELEEGGKLKQIGVSGKKVYYSKI